MLNKIERITDKIVYVSCNPQTLVKDLKFLISKGFKVEEIYLVDMFAQTNHFEVVVKIEKMKINILKSD